MTTPFVDTNVIIHLLTGNDPVKQDAAAALFEEVAAGRKVIAAPVSVIADAAYVLSSSRTFRIAREEVANLLVSLVVLPAFEVERKGTVLRALDLYATHAIDFSDALLVANMEDAESAVVYSYDHHFDQFVHIERIEPTGPSLNGHQ